MSFPCINYLFCGFADMPDSSSSPEHFRDQNGRGTPVNSANQSPNLSRGLMASSAPHQQSPLRVLSHDRLHSVTQDSRDSGCYASTETLQQVQEDFRRAVRSYSFDQAQIAAQFMAIRASSISYQDGQLVQSVQELTSQQEDALLQGRDTVLNGMNSHSTGRLPFITRPGNTNSLTQESAMHNANRSSSATQMHQDKLANDQVQYVASSSMSNLSPRVSPLASPQRSRSSPLRSISHDGTTKYPGFAYGAPPGYNATDLDSAIYASTSDLPLSPSLKLRQQQILRSSPIAIPNARGSSPMGSPHMPHRHSPLGSPLRMYSPSGSPVRGHSPVGSPLLRNRSPRNSPPRVPSPLSSPQRRLQQQYQYQTGDQPPPIPSRLKPNVPERSSSQPRSNLMGQLRYSGISGLRGTARYVNIEDAERQLTGSNSSLPNGHIVNTCTSPPLVSTGSQTPPSSPIHKSKLPLSNYAINNNNNNQSPVGSPTRQPKLPAKRLSRPLSVTLESLIVAKLETEHIDLTSAPYTDEVSEERWQSLKHCQNICWVLEFSLNGTGIH